MEGVDYRMGYSVRPGSLRGWLGACRALLESLLFEEVVRLAGVPVMG
jgi:hypothetical protein